MLGILIGTLQIDERTVVQIIALVKSILDNNTLRSFLYLLLNLVRVIVTDLVAIGNEELGIWFSLHLLLALFKLETKSFKIQLEFKRDIQFSNS